MMLKPVFLAALLSLTTNVYPAAEADPSEPVDVSSEYANALPGLLRAAESGDALAQFYVGKFYEDGLGVERNVEKAFYWMSQAAKQELPEAQISLSDMYATGRGTQKDLMKAAKLLEPFAERGAAGAQLQLARLMHEMGRSYQAASWGLSAGYQGSIEGLYLHARNVLHPGVFWSGYSLRAYLYMIIAIEHGLTDAATERMDRLNIKKYIGNNAEEVICLMYLAGLALPRNLESAREWCEKGIEHGSAIAPFLLGFMWEQGLGGGQSEDEAKRWYTQAMDAGADIAGIFLSHLDTSRSGPMDKDFERDNQLDELQSAVLITSDVSERDLYIFAYQLVRHEARRSASNPRLYRELRRTLFSQKIIWAARQYVTDRT